MSRRRPYGEESATYDINAYRKGRIRQDADLYGVDKYGRNSNAGARRATKADKPKNSLRSTALLLTAALLAICVLVCTDIFSVTSIDVVGGGVDKNLIIAQSGVELGDNIFSVSLGKVKSALSVNAQIDVMSIKRSYPDKIIIEVVGRTPVAAVPYASGYLLLDAGNTVISLSQTLPAGDCLIVHGLNIYAYELGKPLTSENAQSFDTFEKLMKALADGSAMSLVSDITLTSADRITLLTREGITVEMGKAEYLEQKVSSLVRTMPALRERGYKSGVLYITSDKGVVYSEKGEQTE